MTELFLQKATVLLFLVLWVFSALYLYFKGDWTTRRDLIMSFLLGCLTAVGVLFFIFLIVGCILFLIS